MNATLFSVLSALVIGPAFAGSVTVATSLPPLDAILCPIDIGQGGSATCNPCPCEAPTWTRTFAGTYGLSEALSVTVAPDGSAAYVSGIVYHDADDAHSEPWALPVLLAYSSTGEVLWLDSEKYARELVVAPDGETLYGGGSPSFAVDADTGTEIWTNGDVQYAVQDLALSPAGDALFVASSAGGLALDAADGSLLWHQPEPNPMQVAVSPNGSVVYFSSGGGGTWAVHAETGDQLWTTADNALAVTVAPQSGSLYDVHIVRTHAGLSTMRAVRALSPAGAVLWESSPTWHIAGPLALTPDGERLVSVEADFAPALDVVLPWTVTGRDAGDGERLWTVQHPRQYNNRQDPHHDIGITEDGTLTFVLGGRASVGHSAAVTAYSVHNGTLAWTGLAQSPGLRPRDLAVSQDMVYVVSDGQGTLRLDAFQL